VAASFQAAVVDVLVEKTIRAATEHGATEIWIAGGVSANQALRKDMLRRSTIPVRYPPLKLCADNAAMIASAGYFRYLMGYRDDLDMDVRPMWPLIAMSSVEKAG
jgi:N6-L-threonylcarbamoyladenine synthase